ncbi:MAG TPA: 3-dehydroquinate synthase [Acidimicrobiales bacterium]|nr:3-dehydroquinate synthase [Acidimicrobiales bacterium]
MRTVTVELGPRSYPVIIGVGALDAAAGEIPPVPGAERVAIVSDSNVDPAWGDTAARALAPLGSTGEVLRFVVAAGETSKDLAVAGSLLGDLAAARVRRSDVLVALGGGMVGDLAGFVASVYQRGMPFVQVATSLLAQVDAAIGGKTAVNLAAGKNLVGTFYQPRAVIADTTVLSTLPRREYTSGLAEVAKYGFAFDPAFLGLVESSLPAIGAGDPAVLEEVVARSVAIKASVVAADELDLADRRIMLNYGHTLAHALEALGNYEQWLHGEAVSVGMVFAAALARESGLLPPGDAERHRSTLSALGLPVTAAFDPAEIETAWSIDKKYRGGVRWVLLNGIGCPVVTTRVGSREVAAAMSAVLA